MVWRRGKVIHDVFRLKTPTLPSSLLPSFPPSLLPSFPPFLLPPFLPLHPKITQREDVWLIIPTVHGDLHVVSNKMTAAKAGEYEPSLDSADGHWAASQVGRGKRRSRLGWRGGEEERWTRGREQEFKRRREEECTRLEEERSRGSEDARRRE